MFRKRNAPRNCTWWSTRTPRRSWGTENWRPPQRNRRSEEHTSELQSRLHLVCRLLLEKKKKHIIERLVRLKLGSISDVAYSVSVHGHGGPPSNAISVH